MRGSLYAEVHTQSTQTFDAAADGYVRGEACISYLLETQCRGPAPLAVLGAATNSDARSSSLTAPSGPAQQQVIRQALHNIHATVHALSTHGTGTPLGDPIEVQAALGALGGSARTLLASKSQAGHTEPAAGLIGLAVAHALLAQHGTRSILHLRTLNPLVGDAVQAAGQRVLMPRQHAPPVVRGGGAAVGVSAFAFQGVSACHIPYIGTHHQ